MAGGGKNGGGGGDARGGHGGTVPRVSHSMEMNKEEQSNSTVDATTFQVRGPNYLADKIKVASAPAAFDLVEVSGFSTEDKCMFTTERHDSYYKRARALDKKEFLFVMHFDLNPMHVVMVYELHGDALEKDKPFAQTFKRFLAGDDQYKNERLKLITSVVDASWIVKKTIGKPVPALIGNKLTCHYRQTEDMLECTCDVNSSMAAKAILGVVKSACKGITCDLVLLLEGRQEDELPERVIGAARYIKHDLSKYTFLEHQEGS
mmetsp:Transcript_6061/g.11729  ORF Transcript_6061/g.11729 Transcript_6061/m.11729 type:complete len:262 (+) Transcript_6061:263-1048(+)|eukprot:CAMPEP_0173380234 /NCGR_PEP_ID=MMETSP1356-20130122/2956_1 /TAXON_ID=77927 ORGANISM="Hemiselmis virescens, Strain PCC157" /NCGR_SAMPLE_ID=MMETSP1356 /ASSEMBLY_ACC=CAM_ASM_000847 /LENGTH=261 /DNA_ID=CAMNT_0014333757 /DNA_START=243 /DNA_END=1028 /DNA_ORIENTATION=-